MCLQKEEVPGARVTAIKLLAKPSRQVVPLESGCLFLLRFLPSLSVLLPHLSSSQLTPLALSSLYAFPHLGKRKGHLLPFNRAFLLEHEALVEEKWVGF